MHWAQACLPPNSLSKSDLHICSLQCPLNMPLLSTHPATSVHSSCHFCPLNMLLLSTKYATSVCGSDSLKQLSCCFCCTQIFEHWFACCLSMWLCRCQSLEAQLKSLLYYFRHHTVEPEILKRLCFVEIVYMLQSHANRCETVPLKISLVSCLLLCMHCVLFAAVHAFCMSGILSA